MSDLIEPQLIGQLPSTTLPILGTDLIVISRDGINLLKATIDDLPSGSGGATLQTINTASATSGILVTTGANIVRISPAISSNVNFPIVGGNFGDSLTLFIPQNATGGWDVIVDGVDYTQELPAGLTQIVIKLEHDGTNWNLTNTPLWN